jgi:hypothetical protein
MSNVWPKKKEREREKGLSCPSDDVRLQSAPISHTDQGGDGGEDFDWHFQKRQAPNDVENKRNRLQASPIYTQHTGGGESALSAHWSRTDCNQCNICLLLLLLRGERQGGELIIINSILLQLSSSVLFIVIFLSFFPFILTTLGTFCAPLRFWAPANEILWRSLHRPMRKQEKGTQRKKKEKPEGDYMYT